MHREDDLDDESYQVREVYAQYGLALYQASVLETNAWIVTAFGSTLGASREEWTATWDTHFERLRALTFGRLLRALEPHLGQDAALIADLRAANATRNELVHGFFFRYAGALTTSAGREAMLTELILARDEFASLEPRLDAAVRKYLHAIGLTDGELKRRRERHEANLKRPWTD